MRDKLLFAFIMVALAGGSRTFPGAWPSLDHEVGEATLAAPPDTHSPSPVLVVANIEQDF